MVWTFLVFGISLYILSKAVFPRIRQALDERAATINEATEAAERARREADELLAEYRERLKEARAQAEEILQRARQTAEAHEHEARERVPEILAEASKRAEREIDAATKRALDDIRREVADLTIMATEKVMRKTLNDADQRRLVEEASANSTSRRCRRGLRTSGGASSGIRPLAVRGGARTRHDR